MSLGLLTFDSQHFKVSHFFVFCGNKLLIKNINSLLNILFGGANSLLDRVKAKNMFYNMFLFCLGIYFAQGVKFS